MEESPHQSDAGGRRRRQAGRRPAHPRPDPRQGDLMAQASRTDRHRQRASRIRLMIFDVDGVLTDGSLLLHRRRRNDQDIQCARRPRHQAACSQPACRRRSSAARSRASSRRARGTRHHACVPGRARQNRRGIRRIAAETGIDGGRVRLHRRRLARSRRAAPVRLRGGARPTPIPK